MHVLIFCRDPSDWSAETMEEVGPLLLLDDDATSALPNKVSNFCYTFISKSSVIQNGEAFQQCTLLVAMSHACIIMICFVFLPSLRLCQPWMRDILHFLKPRLSYISDALRKKIFDLTTMSTSKATRKKRCEEETCCLLFSSVIVNKNIGDA